MVLANLWIFFGAASFQVYPTRFIGVIGAGIGLTLALFHSGLLELLRRDTALLYSLYAALSVALLLVYYFMEPYFTHEWSKARMAGNNASDLKTEIVVIPANEPDTKEDLLASLSEQERILANLILDGHTETSAARMMNITLNTQKGYRKNLYAKLDIHSKRELFVLMNSSYTN